MEVEKTVEEVFLLFDQYGVESYLGDCISKTNHSIQCAMQAEKDGYSTEIILGALLHDIGHMVGEQQNMPKMIEGDMHLGTKNHELVGASYLRNLGFPDDICTMVQDHVQAKRYLAWKYPGYHSNLSAASKRTLEFQGGIMNEEEATRFESSPLFEVIIKLRRWDEQAKDANCRTESLDKYKEMCFKYLCEMKSMN